MGIKGYKLVDMKQFPALLTIFLFVFLLSCNNNNGEKADTITALNDSTSITGLTGDSVKLVKTAGIHFKVKNVEQSTRDVSALAKKLGGLISNQNMESVEGGRNELKISADSLMVVSTFTPQADITVRIPSENLEDFMYSVTDMGYFIGSRKLHIDDKSLWYLENLLKQKNRTEVLSQPANNKRKTLTAHQTIEIKDEVTGQQINNRTVDADVKYSTVNLSLFQNPIVRKEIIVNYIISDYQLPFGQRFSNAIKDGWQYFLAFAIVLAHLWMFILLTIAILFTYKYLHQKRKLSMLNMKR